MTDTPHKDQCEFKFRTIMSALGQFESDQVFLMLETALDLVTLEYIKILEAAKATQEYFKSKKN